MTARHLLRRIVVWGPLVAYLALIYYLSSRSSVSWAAPYPDKLLHFLEYGGLALLAARALNGTIRRAVPVKVLLVAWSLAVAYAASDEFHQLFVPGRESDWRDLLADALGAATALGLLAVAGRILDGRATTSAPTGKRSARPANEPAP